MFQNFLAKSKEAFSKKKIPLSQLIGYIGKIPMLGKQMVREAAKRSSQRHKCSGCGLIVEVCVVHIIEDPVALLSDDGRQRLFVEEQSPISSTPPPSTTPTTGTSSPVLDEDAAKAMEAAIAAELEACESKPQTATDDDGLSPLTETTMTERTTSVQGHDEHQQQQQPPPSADANDQGGPRSPQVDAGASIAPNRFACTVCNARLGVHCFPGDATNGNKAELMAKLFALFDAMPELIALKLPPSKVKTIVESDIFWVD
jgi:hypothetical protein